MTPALTFLLQALLIVVLPPAILHCLRLRGFVPLVVMQIALSIALGPSALGHWLPEVQRQLFSPASLSVIQGSGGIAVLLFGFLTGLHFDAATLRGQGRAFAVIATASLVAPILLGILSGVWISKLYPAEIGAQATQAQFATAVGICMAVTALPVLAAILRETRPPNRTARAGNRCSQRRRSMAGAGFASDDGDWAVGVGIGPPSQARATASVSDRDDSVSQASVCEDLTCTDGQTWP